MTEISPGPIGSEVGLSKLLITGPLDQETPKVVLRDLLTSHGSFQVEVGGDVWTYDRTTMALLERLDQPNYSLEDHREILVHLRERDIPRIQRPYNLYDHLLLGRFINHRETWSPGPLLTAFQFLWSFQGVSREDLHGFLEATRPLVFGRPTNSNPRTIDVALAYRIFRTLGLSSHPDLPLEAIHRALRLYQEGSEQLVTRLCYQVRSLDRINLIRLLHLTAFPSEQGELGSTIIEEVPSSSSMELHGVTPEMFFQGLEHAIQSLTGPSLIHHVEPRTVYEAIYLAARLHQIDLSTASDVLVEYQQLHRDPDNYRPIDSRLRQQHDLNPMLLRLDHYFNPLLPELLYRNEDLERLVRIEGYNRQEIWQHRAYPLLQEAALVNTFHHGKQPRLQYQRTIYQEEVLELPNEAVVCFGVRGNPMLPYQYEELLAAFRANHTFRNAWYTPSSDFDETFSPLVMTKLKQLCRVIRPGESESLLQTREQLYDTIERIEILTEARNESFSQFYIQYHQSDATVKRSIEVLLFRLQEIGMYMRGWLGPGHEYPLENPPGYSHEVDVRVTEAFHRFEAQLEEADQRSQSLRLGTKLLELPLLKYRPSGYNFHTSNYNLGTDFDVSADIREGLTIGDRLNMVKDGEAYQDQTSCIRLSSNWLVATSYRYLQLLGLEPGFEITLLRDIQ